MRGLASAAAAIAAATLSSPHPDPPVTVLDYGAVHYEIRAVLDGSGLGGAPPYCAANGTDFVLVAYRVFNRADHPISAAAVPRIALVDQGGRSHDRDPGLTEVTERVSLPVLSIRHGELASNESAMLADVFVTPAGSVELQPWRIRPDTLGAEARPLPSPKTVITNDCPRFGPPPTAPAGSEEAADAQGPTSTPHR